MTEQNIQLLATQGPRAVVRAAQAAAPAARVSLTEQTGFELAQRVARMLSASTLVPPQYRQHDPKNGDNPAAMSNCLVALNMANRIGADPLAVMQGLYIVEGRPSWSSQWIIAAINSCGKFSPIRFVMEKLGKRSVTYSVTAWENGQRRQSTKTVEIEDISCTARVTELATGEVLDGPAVTIGAAVAEGWYGKNGSKWQTMPELMLRYRAAAFFGRLYAPELLMGLLTADESEDIANKPVTTAPPINPIMAAEAVEIVDTPTPEPEPTPEPKRSVASRAMRKPAPAPEPAPEPAPAPDADAPDAELFAGDPLPPF